MNDDEMLTRRSLTDVRAILTILAKQTQKKPTVGKREVEESTLLKSQSTMNELPDLS
ncbi:MAG: hypothetical protein KME45_19530 [Stenomitos rutilans HA7619-LM2]|jgi:hypothetical protein|nr:hypothetical protein [Stenomitos rutilans HA7619-LM2]